MTLPVLLLCDPGVTNPVGRRHEGRRLRLATVELDGGQPAVTGTLGSPCAGVGLLGSTMSC